MRVHSYASNRKADQRVVRKIIELLDVNNGAVILDVGAGTGNYSVELNKIGYKMIAIEPSVEMSSVCTDQCVNWINCPAEDILLPDSIADAAILILSLHHFTDIQKAINEIHRVLREDNILVMTFNPCVAIRKMWIFDYCPLLKKYITDRFCDVELLKQLLEIEFSTEYELLSFPLPSDMSDAFSAAAWKNPSQYTNPETRKAMSLFNYIDEKLFISGIEKLKIDLKTGEWYSKYSYLLQGAEYDVGCVFLRRKISRG